MKVVRVAPKVQVPNRDEATRAHRAINWVVSAVLVAFALWSIMFNAEGRSTYKQTALVASEIDAKIETISKDISVIKEFCKQTPIVVPLPTIDTQETP